MSVRARFSTTAHAALSVSEARTALYGWLLARHEEGRFVLRVVGAGTSPHQARHADATCTDLRWLGLDWDEGPRLSTERLARTRRIAAQLVEGGRAEVSPEGAIARAAPHRGAAPEDRVLLDCDGAPTDLLTEVVDDHDAAITHILRSVEPPGEAASYLALCRDLGWTPPLLVQLPPLSSGGLDPTTPVSDLRQEGYAGRAVANWLARLGWSPRGRRRLCPLPELAQRFNVKRVAHSTLHADRAQLDWFSRRYWGQLDVRQVAAMLAVRWQRAYGSADRSQGTGMAPAAWRRTLAQQVIDEVHSLSDAVDAARFAFEERVALRPNATEVLSQAYAPRVLRAFAEGIVAVDPFGEKHIDAFVSELRWEYSDRLGIRSRKVMHAIRAALTGRTDGPCLVAACQVLGKSRSVLRAHQALERVRA